VVRAKGARIIAMKSKIIICVVAGLVCIAQAEAADKVYKWQAEDGSVIFSDTPPPGVKAEELEMPEQTIPSTPSQNQNQNQNQRQQLLRQSEQIDKRIDQRRGKREKALKELGEVRAQIARVKQTLEQGREPGPGEIQHLAGGGTRLAPAYFERIQQQEKEIASLEKRVSELLGELQALR